MGTRAIGPGCVSANSASVLHRPFQKMPWRTPPLAALLRMLIPGHVSKIRNAMLSAGKRTRPSCRQFSREGSPTSRGRARAPGRSVSERVWHRDPVLPLPESSAN